MANTQNSIFAYGVTRSGKIVIADHPKFDDHRVSAEVRGSHREALRDAANFAQMAVEEEAYINRAREIGTTAYNIAIVDWLGAPKVLEIDIDNWSGEVGQVIRVKAKDNVMVASVAVVIRDTDENVLEEGAAVRSGKGSVWWNYTTRSRIKMSPFPIVEATARDLPGNTDSFAIS